MDAAWLAAFLRWRERRSRRELRKRLHDFDVQLVQLRLKVRDIEQQILAGDVNQLDLDSLKHLPGTTNLPSGPHRTDVSKHDPHQDTPQ